MINEEKILNAYRSLTPEKAGEKSHLLGNEEGLIDFGPVNLANLPRSAVAQSGLDWMDAISKKMGPGVAGNLLINAGHECGYHTLTAVKHSEPFQEHIEPMCDDDEDLLKALLLAPMALGVGRFNVAKADSEEVVLRSFRSQDAEQYLDTREEEAEEPVCNRQTGIFTAAPNVVFRGDSLEDEDKVYESEPDVFHPEAYYGKETKCRATGDDYCEIVIRKEFNHNNDREIPEKYL